jgi:hypothetical protein
MPSTHINFQNLIPPIALSNRNFNGAKRFARKTQMKPLSMEAIKANLLFFLIGFIIANVNPTTVDAVQEGMIANAIL